MVIETLLSYANDKESDVRMVSDECLNRITKVGFAVALLRRFVILYLNAEKCLAMVGFIVLRPALCLG